jgi:hypothetical protein
MNKLRKRNYKGKLKKGDLIRTELSGVPGIHVFVSLVDETPRKLVKCLPICNFTSNPPPNIGIVIGVGDYDLPDKYFNTQKTTTWLMCGENLCTYSSNDYTYLVNLLTKHLKPWKKICSASSEWKSNNILTSVCECEQIEN